MDVLNRMLEGVVDRGFISGFLVSSSWHGSLTVSHLLFTNDTLIFCDLDLDQIFSLIALLLCIEVVFGLKVNLSKSEAVPVGSINNLSEMATILDCKVSSLPMKYLGLPLRAHYKSKVMWEGIVEKIEGVTNRLKKMFHDFLWDGIEDAKKFHLIKWDKVCTPLSCNGLGVRKLKTFNKTLLGKWLWHYHQEGDALWRNILDVKYGSVWGGWCSKEVRGAYGVRVCKLIWNGWDDFLGNYRLKVERGTQIKFWHNIWCGDIALKNDFPSLYRIASYQGSSVADNMYNTIDSIHWSMRFTKAVQD
ncbi:uncharacterized protein LOC122306358 [Carya illinoinensis]|uniref:uncharacterized protein LOC122306358 n=1 Tax=Carya illinoinensis TaxID=32201 RepID=UPI001C718FA1|nr:uncharacterized protein LOC122306358 [Carya illinoinensis]